LIWIVTVPFVERFETAAGAGVGLTIAAELPSTALAKWLCPIDRS
jgi:hypothetical protein